MWRRGHTPIKTFSISSCLIISTGYQVAEREIDEPDDDKGIVRQQLMSAVTVTEHAGRVGRYDYRRRSGDRRVIESTRRPRECIICPFLSRERLGIVRSRLYNPSRPYSSRRHCLSARAQGTAYLDPSACTAVMSLSTLPPARSHACISA